MAAFFHYGPVNQVHYPFLMYVKKVYTLTLKNVTIAFMTELPTEFPKEDFDVWAASYDKDVSKYQRLPLCRL